MGFSKEFWSFLFPKRIITPFTRPLLHSINVEDVNKIFSHHFYFSTFTSYYYHQHAITLIKFRQATLHSCHGTTCARQEATLSLHRMREGRHQQQQGSRLRLLWPVDTHTVWNWHHSSAVRARPAVRSRPAVLLQCMFTSSRSSCCCSPGHTTAAILIVTCDIM